MRKPGNKQTQEAYITQELLQEISKIGNRLVIGIPCEQHEYERRLALTPEAVDILTECGHQVIVQNNAGLGINYSDNHYAEAGADIVATAAEVYQADLILKILPPTVEEVALMKPRTTLFSLMQKRLFTQDAFELMMSKRINGVAYDLIADEQQKRPVMSIISEIEGIASITIASELLSNTQGGKGILLGGIPGVSPTEVVIIGAGSAGTVAARAALSLGACVKVFDNDINQLRNIQQNLGVGLFTSTYHPNVLQNAFRSADVVIGAMRHEGGPRRYLIAEGVIQHMKKGALIIDLCMSQGGCFETTCCLSPSDPTIFEQYGVLHYCKPCISNRVARTASMALSNIFVPLFVRLGDIGSIQSMIKTNHGFKAGVYMYSGKPVNEFIASHFNVRSNNIDIYLAAF
ncbi:alanine dehydrogenase [Parabacteroides sp. PF5-9]|uniref:alanine dehydrogenase n=1 Tax=Parabacteroides sp. PF5-9 TaxID=1742404 RepID=UPI00247698CB|nr:alanine dehydrogenase [Parabacteroides sp. PF5-9]MDH6356427.1 alanine dehydrogenase [Parabacteroides sp. PF5-9]